MFPTRPFVHSPMRPCTHRGTLVRVAQIMCTVLLLCVHHGWATKVSPPPPPVSYVVSNYIELASAVSRIQQDWTQSSHLLKLVSGTYAMGMTLLFNTSLNGGSLTIEGAGADATILDCGGAVMPALSFLAAPPALTIRGIQFKSCAPGLQVVHGEGSSQGDVRISSCSFVDNFNSGSHLLNIPNLVLEDCSYINNSAPESTGCTGAALFANLGTVKLRNTIFHENSCTGLASSGALRMASAVNITLTNCSFTKNMATGIAAVVGGAIFDKYQTFQMDGCSFINNSGFGVGSSGALNVYGGKSCVWNGTVFENNVAPRDFSRGAASLFDFSYSLVANSSFLRNSADGGANSFGAFLFISYDPLSVAELYNTSFLQNTAHGYAGIPAMLIGGMHKASLMRVYSAGNACDMDIGRGSMVLYGITGSVLVNESLFEDNRGSCDPNNVRSMHYGSYFSLLHTVDFFKCGGGALFIYQCDAVIASSIFRNNSGASPWFAGGAILAHSVPSLHILNCTFEDNVAAAGGAVCGIANTYIMVDAPINQDVQLSGGVDCTNDPFWNALKGAWPLLVDVFMTATNWETVFARNQAIAGGAIATSESVLSIAFKPQLKCAAPLSARKQVRFVDNRALSGGAISSLRPPGAWFIMFADFINNSALSGLNLSRILGDGEKLEADVLESVAMSWGCGIGNGGAICMSTSGTFKGSNQAIAASNFDGNSATYGGALYVGASGNCADPDTCNMMAVTGLQQCNEHFQALFMPGPGNAMLPNTQVNMTNNNAVGGAGGAIYLQHTGILHVECGPDSVSGSEMGTSSFCWEDAPFNITSKACKAWVGNTAESGAFGNVIASSPVDFTVGLEKPGQMAAYNSGDSMPLVLRLFDMFGQEHVVALANKAQAADVLFRVRASNNNEEFGQMTVESVPGRLSSENSVMMFQAKPGQVNVQVTAKIDRLKRVLPTLSFNVTVRECKIGEFLAKNGYLCLRCDVGRFNFYPNSTECMVCPPHATCTMSTSEEAINPIILPSPQTFHSNPFSTKIVQCPNPKSCDYKGRSDALLEYQSSLSAYDPWSQEMLDVFNISHYNQLQCDAGYTGPACALCQDGYGLSGFAKCVKCKDNESLEAWIIFIVNLAAFLPLLWSMSMAMQNMEKWGALGKMKVFLSRTRQHTVTEAACMKTIVSYLQILGMLKWINTSNSAKMQLNEDLNIFSSAQKVADHIVYVTTNLVSMSCTRKATYSDQDMSVLSMVISFVIPISCFLLLVLIWGFMPLWSLLRSNFMCLLHRNDPQPRGRQLKEGHNSFAIKNRSERSFMRSVHARKHPGRGGDPGDELSHAPEISITYAGLGHGPLSGSSEIEGPLALPSAKVFKTLLTDPIGKLSETNTSEYYSSVLSITQSAKMTAEPNLSMLSSTLSAKVPAEPNLSMLSSTRIAKMTAESNLFMLSSTQSAKVPAEPNSSMQSLFRPSSRYNSSGGFENTPSGSAPTSTAAPPPAQPPAPPEPHHHQHEGFPTSRAALPPAPPSAHSGSHHHQHQGTPPVPTTPTASTPHQHQPTTPFASTHYQHSPTTSSPPPPHHPHHPHHQHPQSPTTSSPQGSRNPEISSRSEPEIISRSEPEISSRSEPELVSRPGPEIVSGPGPDIGSRPGPEIVGGPGPDIVSGPGPELGTRPGPEIVGSPGPDNGNGPGPKLVGSPGPKHVRGPGPEIGSSPGPKHVTRPGPEHVSRPGPDIGNGPGPELVGSPGPKRVSGPGPELVSRPGPEIVSGPGSELVSGPGPVGESLDEDTRLEMGIMDNAAHPPRRPRSAPASAATASVSATAPPHRAHKSSPHKVAARVYDEDEMAERGILQSPRVAIALDSHEADAMDEDTMAELGMEDSYQINPAGIDKEKEKGPLGPTWFDWDEFEGATIVACIISTFYYYSNLVQQTILIFMCSTLDNSDNTSLAKEYGLNLGSRWIMNYGMQCYEGKHLFLVYFLGIPGLIFTVGVPILWGWWLMRNRIRHDEASFRARYSFMYEDYTTEFYAWGSVEMLHKLILMAAMVLLSTNDVPQGVQLITGLTFTLAFTLGHLILLPHFSKLIHRLNLLAELCIVFTLLYCIYLTYDTVSEGFSSVVFLLGLFNIIAVLALVISWAKLVVENQVLKAGLDWKTLHAMSSKTVVELMFPRNSFPPWKFKLMQLFVAWPLMFFYKLGYWIKCLYRVIKKKMHSCYLACFHRSEVTSSA